MKYLYDLVTNYMVASAVAGWFVAQVLKAFTGVFKLKKFTPAEFLFGTGGMPSSHTAAVCALTCSSVIKHGFGSSEFAICATLALIVMRDAMGMRREVGEHAKALNIILKEYSMSLKQDHEHQISALRELVGHTPLQVFAGAVVGIAIPFLVRLIPVFA